ncbi:AMP-binding protein [Sphingomonas sp. CGMCC 1.13654]|uniref:AMP-binding protein n=1 Tax=Sphingomonas chungangi TaxID=2683589 RepID=A0A838LCI2_9SPHN|nr:AMP-binding protein [Sphingomonas chungangi]MBA2935846.1 AMP-binding protein [Sphingomonas chungangi]MVW54537.1 AMP-binding protein [Sphingomonas chungangi]
MQVANEWDGLEPLPQRLDRLALCGRPGDVALVDRDGELDFDGLDRAVGALAAHLADRAVPGDRIASWLPKTRTACLLALACARAGLVHVPVNPLLKRAQVAHILANSDARLLITQPAREKLLEDSDLPVGCRILSEDCLLDHPVPLPPSSGDTDVLAALLYTSGSTGRPKGVMLSHANLWLGAIAVAHYLRVEPGDRTLAVLPLSFDAGLNQLLSTWAAGARAVPLDYLVANDVVRAVERHGITTLAGVPPLWIQLAEAQWPPEVAARLRILSATGGRMPVPLVRRLRELFPRASLTLMYGLTEAFRSTRLDPALVDAHPESIGRAIPFAEVMVVRPDGRIAADGEPGELVHAGSLVGQGYWRDPERTALRYRPAPAGSMLGGMAVWSGDTVKRDADGLLRFVGRDDEMIKVSGNRVSPTEIEEAAVASGAASEAVALGVPDERLGQAIRLVVRGTGDEARLLAHFKAELPTFQQPREVIWVDDLPRNPNGKLDRVAIAKMHGA